MGNWEIFWIVFGIIELISVLFAAAVFILELKNSDHNNWPVLILIAIFFLPIIIIYGLFSSYDYLKEVYKDGGFANHRRRIEEEREKEEKDRERRDAEWEAKKQEEERIKTAYLNGELKREELPRKENGTDCFEFSTEMGIATDYWNEVREIVYVERTYNERLNRFFQEHKDLRLYHLYKFVYLPTLCKELEDGDIFFYFYPDVRTEDKPHVSLDSTYPMEFFAYPEDKEKVEQGMFFFWDGHDNHGAKYTSGDYFPLYEGTDEEIIAQLDTIVKRVHNKHGHSSLNCTIEKPKIKEGSKEYADKQFEWVVPDDEVAVLIREVRERIEKLKEHGIAENLLKKLLEQKPKLSRLLITRDMRIILPDYNSMEIKMEPINKAVYLLFLRHPEGIVFKCLPDYRKELADIYQKIKPFGLNDRALQSIEDVTNPCLNSINEKCARIRGAFISLFDESLAENYYIFGLRGKPKRISLPRDLVVWE